MKFSPIVACVALVFASISSGQEKPAETPITLEELNRRNVVGNLGLPLGTAVEIEAEVVSGRGLGKEYDSLYLLKVTHVDGKELTTPPLIQFSAPGFARVKLANHTFALYELKHGTKTGSLDSAQIEELEKGYVGKKVRLVVYEVGRFDGIPDQLPKDMLVWADVGFHFSTSLIVLKELDAETKSETIIITDAAQIEKHLGKKVTIVGKVSNSKIPRILGVDVSSDEPDLRGKQAQATGILERDEVTEEQVKEMNRLRVAHSGAGVFYRLFDKGSQREAQVVEIK